MDFKYKREILAGSLTAGILLLGLLLHILLERISLPNFLDAIFEIIVIILMIIAMIPVIAIAPILNISLLNFDNYGFIPILNYNGWIAAIIVYTLLAVIIVHFLNKKK